jgi:hypothetical protein
MADETTQKPTKKNRGNKRQRQQIKAKNFSNKKTLQKHILSWHYLVQKRKTERLDELHDLGLIYDTLNGTHPIYTADYLTQKYLTAKANWNNETINTATRVKVKILPMDFVEELLDIGSRSERPLNAYFDHNFNFHPVDKTNNELNEFIENSMDLEHTLFLCAHKFMASWNLLAICRRERTCSYYNGTEFIPSDLGQILLAVMHILEPHIGLGFELAKMTEGPMPITQHDQEGCLRVLWNGRALMAGENAITTRQLTTEEADNIKLNIQQTLAPAHH